MRAMGGVVGVIGAAMVAGCAAAHPGPASVPPEAHEDADVNAGYRAYHDELAAAGTWEQDDVYAVRWCPREDQLQPTPATFSPLAPTSGRGLGLVYIMHLMRVSEDLKAGEKKPFPHAPRPTRRDSITRARHAQPRLRAR